MSTAITFSQSKSFWQQQAPASFSKVKTDKQNLPKTQSFSLNIEGMKQALANVLQREQLARNSNVFISVSNDNGKFERFRIVEASVMHLDLAARYPEIKSYAGQ